MREAVLSALYGVYRRDVNQQQQLLALLLLLLAARGFFHDLVTKVATDMKRDSYFFHIRGFPSRTAHPTTDISARPWR